MKGIFDKSQNRYEHPRVLLLTSSCFNPYTGTGILLRNLFRGWPNDRIAMIHREDFYEDSEYGCAHYRLGRGEEGSIWPFFIMGSKTRDKRTHVKLNGKEEAGGRNAVWTSKLKIKLNRLVIKYLGGTDVGRWPVLSDALNSWISEFRPEVVYAHMSSLRDAKLLRRIATEYSVPFAIHFMDDWLSIRYTRGLLGPLLRRRFVSVVKLLLEQMAVGLVISREMGQAYEERYGHTFLAFPNVVDPCVWADSMPRSRDPGEPFRIVYAGTINNKNFQNLKATANTVRGLYEQGYQIHMDIRSFQPRVEIYRPELEMIPAVRITEVPRSDHGMAALLKDCDLLFLPVDFSRFNVRRMRFSIFAKLPVYMMSGTPILVYGPPEVASVEYAMKEKWAYVVPEEDKEKLKEAIIELASNPALGERLGRRAQEIGTRDFDANEIRPQFHRALAEAARKSN